MNNIVLLYLFSFLLFVLYLLFINKNEESANRKISSLLSEDKTSLLWVIAAFAMIFRLFFSVIGYVGVTNGQFTKGFIETFYEIHMKAGDAPHYMRIAEEWYAAAGENAKYIVFYPLYPVLIRLISLVLGSYFWSGIFVSNTCFAATCVYLYKLTRLDFDLAFQKLK